jgi:hypothetical protein
VDAGERVAGHETSPRLHAEGELGRGEGSLVAEAALAEPVDLLG